MKKKSYLIASLVLMLFIVAGCAGSKLGSRKNEKIHMAANIKPDVINYALVQRQGKPNTLASRGTSRGILDAYAGGLVSLGVSAVKSVIANDKKKYTDTWTTGLNDLYFYDQPSDQGPFDPVGMQFNGFSIKRFIKSGRKAADSLIAVSADFALDTTNYNEIINNAIFRLRVKDIRMYYSKAKIPAGKDSINVDFDITLVTSYVGENGQLYKDVVLGEFFYSLRHAPLDTASSRYNAYYNKLANTRVTGKSFIVPRSYGYYKQSNNQVVPYYNQGAFSIVVKVTESSHDTFANEVILNTSGVAVDVGSGAILQKLTPASGKKKK